MGGVRRHADSGGARTNPRLPEPLHEMFSVTPSEMTARKLFEIVGCFCDEQRKQLDMLQKGEDAIRTIYASFTPEQRVQFFAMLYDRFAEGYDRHMTETGHYRAIRRLLVYSLKYLKTPILDITAGTGEPLSYALEFIENCRSLPAAFDILAPEPIEPGLAHANEISPRMLSIARQKLDGKAEFTLSNAFELPEQLRGKFRTVICAQTFHLIADEDKRKLVRSIRDALVTDGIAIIMEEDPFRITPTQYIEPISLFLSGVVRPIKPRTMIAHFETEDFIYLHDTAVAEIDKEHAMKLYLFAKH